MSEKRNFLSQFSAALSEIGLGFQLETMIEPEKAGPSITFLVAPEQATDFAEAILESVEEWRKTYRH